MASEDSWEDIEGQLKNLTSTLQTLPDDVRTKALEFISKHMASPTKQSNESSSTSSESGVKQSGESSVKLSGESVPSTSEAPTETPSQSTAVRRKRGRPPKNGHISADSENLSKNLQDSTETAVGTNSATQTSPVASSRTSKRIQARKSRISSSPGKQPLITKIKKEDNITDDEEQKPQKHGRKRTDEYSEYSDMVERASTAVISLEGTVSEITEDEEDSLAVADALEALNEGTITMEASDDVADDNDDEFIPPTRKRGRPPKRRLNSSVCHVEVSDGVTDDNDDGFIRPTSTRGCPPKHDRPRGQLGRPRLSTYRTGYTPKPKVYRCPVCRKMLASQQSFREHHRRHTGEFYVCDLCGQKFNTKSAFLVHKRYHQDDPLDFKCTMCQYVVRNQQLLDEHYSSRHDPNRKKGFICCVCGKGFHSNITMEKHMITHATCKPYACNECGFTTAYPEGLAKHRYNVHETVDRKLFECEICGVKLRSKGTYTEHIGRHFNRRNKKCEICEKTFPTASQLASHRRVHLDPKLPCEICGKLLRNKHKLKIHLLVHSGQKDFACPFCNYVTYVKHNLKKHCVARHKVEYPPIEHPRMQKFGLNETTKVTATLRDPVALDCINKIVEAAGGLEETSENEAENDNVGDENAETQYSNVPSPPQLKINLSSPSVESSPAKPSSSSTSLPGIATTVSVDIKPENGAKMTQGVLTAIPVSLITMPLVAYGIAGNYATATLPSVGNTAVVSSDGTAYVTLATVDASQIAEFSRSQQQAIVVPQKVGEA